MASHPRETSPLLQRSASSSSQAPQRQVAHPYRATWLLLLLIVILDISDYLQRAPWLRFVESILCRNYYNEHEPTRFAAIGSVPEKYCKLDPIQNELNRLQGLDMLLSFAPPLLLTIPYGTLSEARGRKLVLNLCLLGHCLHSVLMQVAGRLAEKGLIDVRWYLLSNACFIIGGGEPVAIATLYTMLADLLPATEQPTAFFRLVAAALMTSIVSVPLASFMMRTSIWLPMIVATLIFLSGSCLTVFIPETINPQHGNTPTMTPGTPKRSWYKRLGLDGYGFMLASPILLVFAATFIVQSLGKNTMRFVMQFASKRFDWSIADSSLILPVSSVATLILLLVILPLLTSYLVKRRHLTLNAANMTIAQALITLLVLGLTGIALAPNGWVLLAAVVVYSFGTGFSPAVRSVATTYVPADSIAKAFAVFQVVDTVGSLATGPLLAQVYVYGAELGGIWYGLPFLVSGLLYGVVGVIVIWLRLVGIGGEAEIEQS